ncbi:hypothetical protein FRC10_002025 [Ceratobasidium sp. 414]|nr:hypothetical protein FRC10_002025 [Ceratobasidium sp. 414]
MGNFISHHFPPKSRFEVDQIPDLSGQVMVVTGGNTGVGKETCKVLLSKNAKVYLAARNKVKAEAAIESLRQETGKVPIFLELDLANMASIRKAVDGFKSKEQHLHVLFNNAGVMVPPVEQKTVDGYDLQFGTNTLGHYLFTSLLLPTLIHTAKNSPVADGHVRVVNTSSTAVYHVPKCGIIWETLGTDKASAAACRRLGTVGLYCQSKLGNVLFSNALAKRYADQGIISVSLHPGTDSWSGSEIVRHLAPWIAQALSFLIYPASYGPLTQLYAGTMPEGRQLNGKVFLIPWARLASPGATALNQQLSDRLWDWCEEQVKDH